MDFPILDEIKTAPKRIKILILLYVVLLIFTAVIGFYVLIYFLFIITFLLLTGYIYGSNAFSSMKGITVNRMILIFSVTALLRGLLLFQDQLITRDIIAYVERSTHMLNGRIPYIEFFGGSKPPLYQYMLYVLGLAFGPGRTQFSTFFVVVDAVVAVALFFLARTMYNEATAIKVGLVYAISPLNIIAIGLSGHYEPVIIVFILGAFIFFFKNRYELSGLSLGMAFALKIFPLVLLPFFLSMIRTWKDRLIFFFLFFVPMIISLIPLLVIEPEAVKYFFFEESGWTGWLGFSSMLEAITNIKYISIIKVSWIFMGLFMLLTLFLFITWLNKDEREKHTKFWYKTVIIITVIYYGINIPMAAIYYNLELSAVNIIKYMVIPVIFYYLIAVYFIYRYLNVLVPDQIDKHDHVILTSIFAIMFFIFGLPNFTAWYLLWFLPLLLLIQNNKIRMTLLWLIFWHSTGEGVSLLPGLFPVN